jgi:prepilin-type N-terminal cleavage/methylation domain-containing protein
MTHTTSRTGFTLLEVMLVMAIIVMLAAFAWPSFESSFAYARATAAADSVKGALAQARARAIEDSVPYRFSVVVGTTHWRVAPDRAEFWSGNVPEMSASGQNPPLVLEDTLPKGVLFTTEGNEQVAPKGSKDDDGGEVEPSAYTTVAVFLPDGTARDDTVITLGTDGTKRVTLRLRSLTGTVKTLTGKEQR